MIGYPVYDTNGSELSRLASKAEGLAATSSDGAASDAASNASASGTDAMAEKACELVAELSVEGHFVLPEPFEDSGPNMVGAFEIIGGGAECNAYLHRPTMMVYKVPHVNNWKYWGDREDMPRAMAESVVLQTIRYARVDALRLAGLGAQYEPTWFIGAKDPACDDVFVIAQAYLDPEIYVPHVLSAALRAQFELAHVDDLSAANVLLNVRSKKLILMDCLFATDIE